MGEGVKGVKTRSVHTWHSVHDIPHDMHCTCILYHRDSGTGAGYMSFTKVVGICTIEFRSGGCECERESTRRVPDVLL
jgi:hypothetical protein